MKLKKQQQIDCINSEIDSILTRWNKCDKSFIMAERLQYQLFGMRSVIGFTFGIEHELYNFASDVITLIINDTSRGN